MVQGQALTIGRLAEVGGVGVETIRFYQRRGLLDIPSRDQGMRRDGADALRRLRFIRQAQSAGFTLEEIRELLALDASEDRKRVRDLAARRIQALNGKIADLERARSALDRLAKECGSTASGPCPILAAFEE